MKIWKCSKHYGYGCYYRTVDYKSLEVNGKIKPQVSKHIPMKYCHMLISEGKSLNNRTELQSTGHYYIAYCSWGFEYQF